LAAVEAVPAMEEKTEFNLVLEEVPTSGRIAVIKAMRTLTALGLKEEDMIEGLPKKVKEGVSKEDAEEALKTLEAA
jgi:large subunit ribosomal protein L7/L12